MGLGIRVILIEANGNLRKIPYSFYDRLENGEKAQLPEYAHQHLRFAFVLLNVHQKLVISIQHIEYGLLSFDSTGAIDQKLKQKALRLIPSPADLLFQDPNYFRSQYKWKPSSHLERQIKTLALSR